MLSFLLRKVIQRWEERHGFRSLAFTRPGPPAVTFCLCDETAVNYQIDVYCGQLGLTARVYVSSYQLSGPRVLDFKQQLRTVSLLALTRQLDACLSIVHGWMAEHGSHSLKANCQPVSVLPELLRSLGSQQSPGK